MIDVETGDAPAVTWEPAAVGELSLGAAVFALADPSGRGLRTTFGLVSATDRSFRGPGGRRVGGSIEHTAPLPRGSSRRPAGRCRGPPARAERRAARGRPDPRRARRRGGARAGRRARARRGGRAPTVGRGARAAPPRAADAQRGRAARARGSARPRRRRREPGRDGRAAARRPARSAPTDGLWRAVDDLFDALDAAGETLSLRVLRGTDEQRPRGRARRLARTSVREVLR